MKDLVGLPIFSDKKMYQGIPPPGVIVGLAYNSYGGSIMYIETMTYSSTSKIIDPTIIKSIEPENNKNKDQAAVI